MVNNRWTLLGIVSHGLGIDCNPKDYVVFVTVPNFVDWVNRNAVKSSTSQVKKPIQTTKRSKPQLIPLIDLN